MTAAGVSECPPQGRSSEEGNNQLFAEAACNYVAQQRIQPLALALGGIGTRVASAGRKSVNEPPSAADEQTRKRGERDGNRRFRGPQRGESHRRSGGLNRHPGAGAKTLVRMTS